MFILQEITLQPGCINNLLVLPLFFYDFKVNKQVNIRGQHIGMLFTFLAGLIILAHAVVPHHHHFELNHSSEQESTCEIPEQEKNTENPDSHCHALNTLVTERTTNSSLNHPLSENSSFLLSKFIVDFELQPVKKITTKFLGHPVIFIKLFFITTQSLRAPPVSA